MRCIVVWEASDGKHFDNRDDCYSYERDTNLLQVISAALWKCPIDEDHAGFLYSVLKMKYNFTVKETGEHVV